MKWIIVLLALLIGIGIGIAYEKKVTHNTVNIQVGVASQEALVNPNPGDVIQWHHGSDQVSVLWPFGSPCDPSLPAWECRVLDAARNLSYYYQCPNNNPCDPDVPIGSDIGILGPRTRLTTPATATLAPPEVHAGCLTSNNHVDAILSPQPVSESQQGAVVWQGSGPATNNWSISAWQDSSGNPAAVCTQTQIDYTQPACTLTNGLAAGNYTYQLTSSACTAGTSGRFALQVGQ